MAARNVRSQALTHLVGDTRAFIQQIDGAMSDLTQLRDPGLELIIKALSELSPKLKVLDDLGTAKLKEVCG